METIYLDHNATTPLCENALNAMSPFWQNSFFNPSAGYPQAQAVQELIEQERLHLLSLLTPQGGYDLIFTSGGTEANALAIQGFARTLNNSKGHLITSSIEHSSVLENFKYLEKQGFDVTYLPAAESGLFELDVLTSALRSDTLLISIMSANNETGVVQPISEIATICQKKGILFHTDAVQALGKIPLPMSLWQPDFLTFSGHKFYGPKGAGALLVKKGSPLSPLLLGGLQESSLRAGTENVPAIIGMCKALQEQLARLDQEVKRLSQLRNFFEKELQKRIPETVIHGAAQNRIPNTTSAGFSFVNAKSLVQSLASENILVATSAACAATKGPSRVLQAMKIPLPLILGTLRFSTGLHTSENDLERVLTILVSLIAKQRQRSWLWQNRTKEFTP